jgi:hypothetical protein
VILRIKLLYKSATYTFPTASLATPIGVLKEAAVPEPLVVPAAPLPANVVTVATELIGSELLITVLHWAATFPLVKHKIRMKKRRFAAYCRFWATKQRPFVKGPLIVV